MLATERYCPFAFMKDEQMDVNGVVSRQKCYGAKCAFFRGLDTDKSGICAVPDVAGYLGLLFELAKGKKDATQEDKKA